MLIEKNLSETIEKGEYVFLKEGIISSGWESGEDAAMNALQTILLVSDGIKAGDWSKTDDNTLCSGCEFKGICRRRMAIQ